MRLLPIRLILSLTLAVCLALTAAAPVLAGSGSGGGGGVSGGGGSTGPGGGGGGGGGDDGADDDGGGGHGADDTTPSTTATPSASTAGSTSSGAAASSTTTGSATVRDVRTAGRCSGRPLASTRIRVRGEDGTLDVRFEIRDATAGSTWRVVVVHENRIAWRGNLRATSTGGAVRLRRQLRDLAGSESVTAHAWGPEGRGCRASITVPA